MDIAARLIQFRDYTELSNSQFADKAGIPRPTFSQFLNGRNKRLSDDLASKIHSSFPCLNMMWLMFGEGDMLIDSNIEISEGKNQHFKADSGNIHAENHNNSDGDRPIMGNLFNDSIQTKERPEANPEDFFTRKETSFPKDAPANAGTAMVKPNPSKTVKHIMVFYTDNSYEEFRPAGNVKQS